MNVIKSIGMGNLAHRHSFHQFLRLNCMMIHLFYSLALFRTPMNKRIFEWNWTLIEGYSAFCDHHYKNSSIFTIHWMSIRNKDKRLKTNRSGLNEGVFVIVTLNECVMFLFTLVLHAIQKKTFKYVNSLHIECSRRRSTWIQQIAIVRAFAASFINVVRIYWWFKRFHIQLDRRHMSMYRTIFIQNRGSLASELNIKSI